jgi:hypothetical protein
MMEEIAKKLPVTKQQQRIYDAMLIKTFRENKRMAELGNWLKPWNIDLLTHDFERCPENIWWPERMQEMVGRYMRPLADRLWDTERSQDIITLDWMINIKIGKKITQWDKDRKILKRESNRNRKFAGFLQGNYSANLRENQWKVTK